MFVYKRKRVRVRVRVRICAYASRCVFIKSLSMHMLFRPYVYVYRYPICNFICYIFNLYFYSKYFWYQFNNYKVFLKNFVLYIVFQFSFYCKSHLIFTYITIERTIVRKWGQKLNFVVAFLNRFKLFLP